MVVLVRRPSNCWCLRLTLSLPVSQTSRIRTLPLSLPLSILTDHKAIGFINFHSLLKQCSYPYLCVFMMNKKGEGGGGGTED